MAVGEHGDGAIVIRPIAIMMQRMMERRTGRHGQEQENLENEERGQDCFGGPAKIETTARYGFESHEGR